MIHQVGHGTESVMEIKACVALCKVDGFAPGWGFLWFLTRDFVPREWILTKIFRKMSNPHPLPDPLPQGHNIDRCIIVTLALYLFTCSGIFQHSHGKVSK